MIQLTELNKALLREVLRRGMNGSYYEYGKKPAGDDIRAFLNMERDEIGEDRLAAIAKFYDISESYLSKVISDKDECEDWLSWRACPSDDPW